MFFKKIVMEKLYILLRVQLVNGQKRLRVG